MRKIGKAPAKAPSLAVQIKEAAQRAELDAIERAARFAAEQEERDRNAWRAEVATAAKADRRHVDTERAKVVAQRTVPYLPLVLVNTLAVFGQLGWGRANLDGGLLVAVLFAATMESIALFLAYYANRALARRDSANGLYAAAFAVAGVVAWINYSHYAGPDHTPTATAVAFALCSLSSPWLWRIHSRAENRDLLKAAGEIDSRAVKLSLARKVWHPVKSFGVIRMAAWTGESNPAAAVAAWEAARADRKVRVTFERARKQARRAESDSKEINSGPAPQVKKSTIKRPAHADGPGSGPRPRVAIGGDHTQHPKYADGVRIYRQSLEGPGRPLSQRDLAGLLDMKNRELATKIIKDVNGENEHRENHAVPTHAG